MAIQFTNELLTINPAYNDSIINYSSSTLTGVTYSEIAIDSSVFKVYPIGGVFTYNFKEIAKVLINKNNFTDTIIPNLLDKFIYDDSTLSLTLTPTIKIYNTNSSEQVTKNFNFIKSVEQLIGYKEKSAIINNIKILLPTTNNIDFYLPYFEGYPIDFSIYGLTNTSSFYFKNISTISSSVIFPSTTSEVKRIYLSDGALSENDTNLIDLSSTVNNVELWVNGAFNSNIKIKKYDSKCGVYLKWFNANGSYSYWLFDEIFNDTISTSTIDEINGVYGNLQNITSTSNITGKVGNRNYKLTTKFSEVEKEYITSLLLSPSVEMYVHHTPFNQTDTAKFIGVKVNNSSTTLNNKYSNHKMDITITLPDLFTQTL